MPDDAGVLTDEPQVSGLLPMPGASVVRLCA